MNYFTIEVERVEKDKEIKIDDLIRHKECGGKINTEEIYNGKTTLNLKDKYSINNFLEFNCARCRKILWIEMEKNPIETIMKTALDGQKRTVDSYGEIAKKYSKYSHNILGKKGGIDTEMVSVVVVRAIKVGETQELHCPYCGGQLMPKGTYCPFCGANLSNRIPDSTVKKTK